MLNQSNVQKLNIKLFRKTLQFRMTESGGTSLWGICRNAMKTFQDRLAFKKLQVCLAKSFILKLILRQS